MDPWNILETVSDWGDTVLDWAFNWRFNLCAIGGLILSAIVAGIIPSEPLRWIAVGIVLVSSVVVGCRWNR